MVEKVDHTNFEEKILNAEEPVLLSCLHIDDVDRESRANLSSLSEKFQGRVKIFLFSSDYFFLCRSFCIIGAIPSFIALKKGKEMVRLYGRVSFDSLLLLCDNMLPRDH